MKGSGRSFQPQGGPPECWRARGPESPGLQRAPGGATAHGWWYHNSCSDWLGRCIVSCKLKSAAEQSTPKLRGIQPLSFPSCAHIFSLAGIHLDLAPRPWLVQVVTCPSAPWALWTCPSRAAAEALEHRPHCRTTLRARAGITGSVGQSRSHSQA